MPRDYGFPSSRERRGRMSKTARLLALVLSASLALAAYGTASAQTPPDVDVSLTAEIDEESAACMVGDPITLHPDRHPSAGLQGDLPASPLRLGGL